ncbi:hypothetical protein A6A40_23850 (plasmid) [Azospirillum humicireducens]|uniref:Tetratricopeptide repeat protein n=2 Tax=Azospirillum humicireducens TaxID=1226968 RepID=A0A2R4VUH2_9PROT|nr:hypothetical protein A6A40_23850 [Azospirillum humicireducens]
MADAIAVEAATHDPDFAKKMQLVRELALLAQGRADDFRASIQVSWPSLCVDDRKILEQAVTTLILETRSAVQASQNLSYVEAMEQVDSTSGLWMLHRARLLGWMEREAEGIAILNTLVNRLSSKQLADVWATYGQRKSWAGLYQEAAVYLERAFGLDPEDVDSGRMLAIAWMMLEEFDGMDRVLRQIELLAPDDLELVQIRAQWCMATGKLDRALELCSKAKVGLPPRQAYQSWCFSAFIHLSQNDSAMAMVDLAEAERLAAGYRWGEIWTKSSRGVGLALCRDGKEGIALGEAALAACNAGGGPVGWVLVNLALSYMGVGRQREAETMIREAVHRDGSNLRHEARLRPWATQRLIAVLDGIKL